MSYKSANLFEWYMSQHAVAIMIQEGDKRIA